jgi:uncharacterized protein YoxC
MHARAMEKVAVMREQLEAMYQQGSDLLDARDDAKTKWRSAKSDILHDIAVHRGIDSKTKQRIMTHKGVDDLIAEKDAPNLPQEVRSKLAELGPMVEASRKVGEAFLSHERDLNEFSDRVRNVARRENAKIAEVVGQAIKKQSMAKHRISDEQYEHDRAAMQGYLSGLSRTAKPEMVGIHAACNEAAAFYGDVVNPSIYGAAIKNVIPYVETTKSGRSSVGGRYMTLHYHDSADVVAHELGHVLEGAIPANSRLARAFASSRCRDEDDIAMTTFDPSAFGSHEIGNPDSFEKAMREVLIGKQFRPKLGSLVNHEAPMKAAYTGKLYKDGSTEIISMGMEMMQASPGAFAKADPEYFDLIVGVAAGLAGHR